MEVFTILLSLLFAAAATIWFYLTRKRHLLRHLSLPMDPPFLCFGSPPFAYHKVKVHEDTKSRLDKFGKTYCKFDGSTPVVVTIDPEIIKQVIVKNADSFTDTFNLEFDDKHTTLDVSRGEKWRALRKNLSPIFTSGKLKGMLEPMSEVADKLIEYIDKDRKKSASGIIDLRFAFQGLALDTIAKCAFGIETDANNNPNQDIVKDGKNAFAAFRADSWYMSFLFQLFFLFPEFTEYLPLIPPEIDRLREMTAAIIKTRKQEKITNDDFVDKLMGLLDGLKTNPDSNVLSEDIILAQGIIFFIAGFETSANTLATLFYNLAKNPEEQERVYEDVRSVLDSTDGHINHETIGEMKYLEAAVDEDLRLSGPISLHTRLCTKDCQVTPNLFIKKGTRIDMPIWSSHHNPEYFPEPEAFKPERFLKENADKIIPYTYRPFGGGQRLCIGQRFALIEVKIAAAKILSKFRIIAVPETKLDYNTGEIFLLSYDNMKVKLEERAAA